MEEDSNPENCLDQNKQTKKPQKLTFWGILNKMVAPLLNMELPINFLCLSLFFSIFKSEA